MYISYGMKYWWIGGCMRECQIKFHQCDTIISIPHEIGPPNYNPPILGKKQK